MHGRVGAAGRCSLVILASGTILALAALPASDAVAASGAQAAAACPVDNAPKITSYHGTVSTSFASGSITGPSGVQYPDTVSIDHQASNLAFTVTGSDQQGVLQFANSTLTGGTVSVNDSYHDPNPPPTVPASYDETQTANGSPDPANSTLSIEMGTGCTYQVDAVFSIATQSAGNSPFTDKAVTDQAESPYDAIPSNFVFKGTAQLPVDWGSPNPAVYSLNQDPVWGNAEYDLAANDDADHQYATMTWDLTPNGNCVVPKLAGKSQSAAAKALLAAGCTLGRIMHARSPKVAKGKVISTSPKAGKKLAIASNVALTVSSG